MAEGGVMKAFLVALVVGACIALMVHTFGLAGASPAQSQVLPSFTEQRMNQTFQVMKNNVAMIKEPSTERERWHANVAMWQTLLDHLNDPQNTNTKELSDTFRIMRANIYDIGVSSERDRWDDNVQLWRLMIARLEDPTIQSMTQFDYALGDMDANVCCILEKGEHGRWQANHDLWQLLVVRLGNRPLLKSVDEK
jgi:hypothetical protein